MGLIDNGVMTDPNLAFAMGLLQASGPSRMPVSLGQAMGAGMQNAQQWKQTNLQNQLQNNQLQMSDLQLKQAQALQDWYAKRNAGIQGSSASSNVSPDITSISPNQPQGLIAPQAQPTTALAGQPAQPSANTTSMGSNDLDAMYSQYRDMALSGIPQLAQQGQDGMIKVLGISPAYKDPMSVKLISMGIMPGTPQYSEAMNRNINKENYIAPTSLRPGAGYLTADGQYHTSPSAAPEGFSNVVDPTSPTGVKVVETPGAIPAIQSSTQATNLGKTLGTPQSVYNPVTKQMETKLGSEIYGTQGNTTADPQNAPGWSGTRLSQVDTQKLVNAAASGDPDAKAALAAYIQENPNPKLPAKSTGVPIGAPLGATTTADESAKDAVANYNEMHSFSTTSAPRNIGLLQSISQLADKTLAGPGASKAMFLSGVLQTMGITPTSNANQNYQIMKKNLNMLVGSQRISAGGGGSDALQSLLESANPNVSEMNSPALKEAAQELIAYNRMMMAKDKILPNPVNSDASSFQNAESDFSRNYGDPRMWQIEHAANDNERLRILSLIPKDDRASFLAKAKSARQAGVLN